MNVCERLSDRMPTVARGESWAVEEAAHLESCADCAAEWALVRSAQALGTGLAGDLNAHHVTERVLGRLRAQRAASRTRLRGLALTGLAAAAALALTVWSSPANDSAGRALLAVADSDLTLPELDSLHTPELEALLLTMDRASDDATIDLVPAPPNDPDDGELDGVLEALEG
jgi:hypothetical protein